MGLINTTLQDFEGVAFYSANSDAVAAEDFCESVAGQRQVLKQTLLQRGALLFRGFGIDTPAALQGFCAAMEAELMDYPRGISPRTELDNRVYTSTEAPPNAPLPIHTEMSYTSTFPQAIAFCCAIAPKSGGETPLADMYKVLARLPDEMVAEFEQRGILYHQYAPSGHNNVRTKTWQDMFSTEDQSEAERRAAEQQVTITWCKNGAAQLTNGGQVTRKHPVSGERTWFNQVGTFHHSMSAEFKYIGRPIVGGLVRFYEFLLDHTPHGALPYPFGITFGDGVPVPRDYIMTVRKAIWAETVSFSWEKGDLLLIDNFHFGHGRFPFSGERKILASLIKTIY